jgi:hypothetical protein
VAVASQLDETLDETVTVLVDDSVAKKRQDPESPPNLKVVGQNPEATVVDDKGDEMAVEAAEEPVSLLPTSGTPQGLSSRSPRNQPIHGRAPTKGFTFSGPFNETKLGTAHEAKLVAATRTASTAKSNTYSSRAGKVFPLEPQKHRAVPMRPKSASRLVQKRPQAETAKWSVEKPHPQEAHEQGLDPWEGNSLNPWDNDGQVSGRLDGSSWHSSDRPLRPRQPSPYWN